MSWQQQPNMWSAADGNDQQQQQPPASASASAQDEELLPEFGDLPYCYPGSAADGSEGLDAASLMQYEELLGRPVHRGLVAVSAPREQPGAGLDRNSLLPGPISGFESLLQPATATTSTGPHSGSLQAAQTVQAASSRAAVAARPPAALEVPVAPIWIEENSCFTSETDPVLLAAALHAQLASDGRVQWRILPNASDLEVEGVCYPPAGSSFGFQIHVWKNDRPGRGRYVVEVQRRRGCVLQFHAWFRELVQGLGSDVVVGDRWGDRFVPAYNRIESLPFDLNAMSFATGDADAEDADDLPPPPPMPLAPAAPMEFHQETTDALWNMVASPIADLRMQALELLAQTLSSAPAPAPAPAPAGVQTTGNPAVSSKSTAAGYLGRDNNLQQHLAVFADVLRDQQQNPDAASQRSISIILRAMAQDPACHPALLSSVLVPMVKLAAPATGGVPQDRPDSWQLPSQLETLKASVREVLASLQRTNAPELSERLRSLGAVVA